jgi:hypothetical protein
VPVLVPRRECSVGQGKRGLSELGRLFAAQIQRRARSTIVARYRFTRSSWKSSEHSTVKRLSTFYHS